MLLPLLLSAAMLTQNDVAALQSSKLPPNATNNISVIAGSRAVTLAKATYATYTTGTTLQTAMSYLIPGNTLEVGDCFRVQIGGSATNTSGGNVPIGGVLVLTQGSTVVEYGYRTGTIPSSANSIAWRSEILICAGIFGANTQYLSGAGRLQTGTYNTNPRANAQLPNAALSFTGYGNTLLSDSTFSGVGTFVGGTLTNMPGAPVGSGMMANLQQVSFSGAQPVLFEVKVGNLTAANVTIVVGSGTLEGL